MHSIPGFGEYLIRLEHATFRIRPSLPIDPLLAQPGAVERITAALDDLLASNAGIERPSSQVIAYRKFIPRLRALC